MEAKKKENQELLQKVIVKNMQLLQLRAGQTALAFMHILSYDWKLRVRESKEYG